MKIHAFASLNRCGTTAIDSCLTLLLCILLTSCTEPLVGRMTLTTKGATQSRDTDGAATLLAETKDVHLVTLQDRSDIELDSGRRVKLPIDLFCNRILLAPGECTIAVRLVEVTLTIDGYQPAMWQTGSSTLHFTAEAGWTYVVTTHFTQNWGGLSRKDVKYTIEKRRTQKTPLPQHDPARGGNSRSSSPSDS